MEHVWSHIALIFLSAWLPTVVILIWKSRDIGSDSCGGGFYTELNWGLGTLAVSRNVSFKIPFYIIVQYTLNPFARLMLLNM